MSRVKRSTFKVLELRKIHNFWVWQNRFAKHPWTASSCS